MVSLIDLFVALKYLVMIAESLIYKKSYPIVILVSVLVKFTIQAAVVLVEWPFVFRKLAFHLCKITYALKFVEILFVIL